MRAHYCLCIIPSLFDGGRLLGKNLYFCRLALILFLVQFFLIRDWGLISIHFALLSFKVFYLTFVLLDEQAQEVVHET